MDIASSPDERHAIVPDFPGFLARIARDVPAHCILTRPEQTRVYECDGLSLYREQPPVVVLPENEAQVIAILKACHEHNVPVVPRGAGPGLSGGAPPPPPGGVIGLAGRKRSRA